MTWRDAVGLFWLIAFSTALGMIIGTLYNLQGLPR